MLMIKSFSELRSRAIEKGPGRCVVAAAADPVTLEALSQASGEGIAKGILCGVKEEIEKAADDAGISLEDFEISDCKASEAATVAVREVRDNGDFLLKGHLPTSQFLGAVLDKEQGLRTGRVLSHIAILEARNLGRLLLISDGGMNIAPDLGTKLDIINNAIEVAHSLGITEPKIALLAAVEKVNPKMPETIEWAEITQMAARKQIKGALVDGPLALDLAVSEEAVKIKGVKSEVAGAADILIVPDIATGNIFAKGLIYLGGAQACGIVAGAAKPVVMLSRADDAETKLNSIALGAVASGT
ncbi:bifunctional enoyl-CoA hydratase/phosphate acetyltransferase [candidate division WOR-3 bacterium]|uniref:Bifunctional enoyl-CoA hydratase/phosphate acetyltransferase n=1 Tax=candidate division WOR-3 bacterium TaxID=2052148 RepID=A0A9D5QBW4_UNCW3|nr:bifunctional enoyl-CoA hydratase/phosphate acetyltransferase [candidate division WOR-3 bacterium]MBD3363899.1 bifunctional enoyl-CoA hydratase/phosphate acetyltransferase [candidate division WOR-3 bacterium]